MTSFTQPWTTTASETVLTNFGKVDILINAAGIMLPGPIEEGDVDEWQRMLDVNVAGLLHVNRAFTPSLASVATDGHVADVVNISSGAARISFPGYAVYSATKAAVTMLSASLRTEFGPLGVRVTNISNPA